MKEFGIGPGGRIFNLAGGGIITDQVYLAVFHDARTAAFTDTEPRRCSSAVPTTGGTWPSPCG
jgi:hypothetical protein